MIIDSQQGTQMSPRQRLMLEQQRRVVAFMNPVLQQSVDDTLKALEVRKEQGVRPEKIWFLDRQEHGTLSIAEWMGF